MRHQDIIGFTQTVRSGLGVTQFKPFSQSKERRDAVVKDVRQVEQESRYIHLARCSQQGQCLRWEEKVIERRLNWKEIWEWEPARLSFLLKSTYDMLPTPANLVRWKISEDDKCKCGKVGTLRHILSACPIGVKKRYTWRHNQVLQVFFKYMKEKILEINEGKILTIETRKKITFHKEGQRSNVIKSTVTMKKDEKWNGIWKIEPDLDTKLVFPVTETMQLPDLIVWSEEQRHIITLELSVSWEDNIKDAELRKEQRYEELIDTCVDKGWTT